MAKTISLPVEDLSLDLRNFRMTPQANERTAIHGMVAVNPDWFWALMESLLAEDGYLPTENILVLKDRTKLVVKEGNRRIAVLKLIHGCIKRGPYQVPDHLEKAVQAITPAWLAANKEVPCTIYDAKDRAKVDRIVNLVHGKGEKAGRDKWEAVTRARHDRDVNGASVPALDLLERHLRDGSNITDFQRERWGGDYPYSVLEEAIKKIAPRFNLNSRELADAYPKKVTYRAELESVLLAIGLGTVSFDSMRHQGALDHSNCPRPPLRRRRHRRNKDLVAGRILVETRRVVGRRRRTTNPNRQSRRLIPWIHRPRSGPPLPDSSLSASTAGRWWSYSMRQEI